MKVRHFLERLCILLFVCLIISAVATSCAASKYELEEVFYTVKENDSLWTIANEYRPDSMYVFTYIDLVVERNGLDSATIYPGQRLIVYQSQN